MSHTLYINKAASRIILAAAGFSLSISDAATNPPPPALIDTLCKFRDLNEELQDNGNRSLAVELNDTDIAGLIAVTMLFVQGVSLGLVTLSELEELQLCQIIETLNTYVQEASDATFG